VAEGLTVLEEVLAYSDDFATRFRFIPPCCSD